MTGLLLQERELHDRLDSINSELNEPGLIDIEPAFVDTFEAPQIRKPSPESLKLKSKNDERIRSLEHQYRLTKEEFEAIRFSIDSLRQMR